MNATPPAAGLPPGAPCWRVGLGAMSKPALRQRLADAGVQFNAMAQQLFDDARFRVAEPRVTVDCGPCRVAALGLPDGATFDRIVAAAGARGLGLCPLELAPQLRLLLHDQPEAPAAPATRGRAPPGAVTVASAALDDDDATPKGFYLRHVEGVRWLRGYTSWPGHVWSPDDVLVFAWPARQGA